jgi:formylglycine-generating enzyme required for sulfatase activity
VVEVSWYGAAAYCEHNGLELPTEAQWEYAARGPESRAYPWGDDWDPKRLCWDENRGPEGQTFPVGSFPSGGSWCGALDMSGNVWEWCADWYGSDYYGSSPTTDPTGPTNGEYRVLRGGSWGSYADYCRAAGRLSFTPDFSDDGLGFRVARSCR